MNKGALQAEPCAAFCQLGITFPAPAWQTNARPDDAIQSALLDEVCTCIIWWQQMLIKYWGKRRLNQGLNFSAKVISRYLCQKVGRELFREKDGLGMCLCMDRVLVKNSLLENKTCMWLQSSPTLSWGLTGSQSCSAQAVLTSADVGIGIQLMPLKPEISRESLQRPKYAQDQSDTICCDKAGYLSLS